MSCQNTGSYRSRVSVMWRRPLLSVSQPCSCMRHQWTMSLSRVFRWYAVRLLPTLSVQYLSTAWWLMAQYLSDIPYGDEVVIISVFTVCRLYLLLIVVASLRFYRLPLVLCGIPTLFPSRYSDESGELTVWCDIGLLCV